MDDWRRSAGSEDAALFDAFAKRAEQFREFRRELVRRGVEIGAEAGRARLGQPAPWRSFASASARW